MIAVRPAVPRERGTVGWSVRPRRV